MTAPGSIPGGGGMPPAPGVATGLPAWLTLVLAGACGLIVANLYYAQPLVAPIAASIGLSPQASGLAVTLFQVGYGLGLLLLVPLADLWENRRLVVAALVVTGLALAMAGLAVSSFQFLAAALVIGLFSVAAQILVPYAAHLAPEATRGRAVGNVMSGLLLGIMLARPVSSLIADLLGWHWVFRLSALAILVLAAVLSRVLPVRRPTTALGYGELLATLVQLLRDTPVLRRRALYHACLFAAFSLFWTVAPLRLLGPEFQVSQRGVALFALVGVAGAISAPLAGRLADRGWSRPLTGIAMALVALAFLLTRLAPDGSLAALVLLTVAGVVLDFGVSANLVLGQRAIFALGAEYRSRLNGLYMAIFFGGGAAGSALGAWAYAQGGWPLSVWLGLALPVAAGLYFATEAGERACARAGR